jgi:hypothetical protein
MANDISAAATGIGPIVETVSGKLRGSLDNGIHTFKGVPPHGRKHVELNRLYVVRNVGSIAKLRLGGRQQRLVGHKPIESLAIQSSQAKRRHAGIERHRCMSNSPRFEVQSHVH